MNNRMIWDHVWLPNKLKKDRIDIALFMKGTMSFNLPCKGGVIFHDLGYFDYKLRPYKFLETIYMQKMMARASRKAAVVFADSKYTKSEAIKIFKIDPKKIAWQGHLWVTLTSNSNTA